MKTTIFAVVLLVVALALAGCKRDDQAAVRRGEGQTGVGQHDSPGPVPQQGEGQTPASGIAQKVVQLKDAQGQGVGTATIISGTRGVVVRFELQKLPPGEHAVHFHQNAKCDPPDFKSAGEHFNPEGKKHGLDVEGGAHAGDMENIRVRDDGSFNGSVSNDRMELAPGDIANSVFAKGGTALVIHERADDQKSQPSGNAGARIACGVVTP